MTAVAVTVTRTELSAAPLDLTTAPFEVHEEGLDVGATIWRKEFARSPYIHGGQLVTAVKDVVEGCTLAVDVTGASQAAIATSLGTLFAAFSQWAYTLQVSLDGSAYSWACSPADWSVGIVSNDLVFGLVCPVRLSFARQPIPVSGPA